MLLFSILNYSHTEWIAALFLLVVSEHIYEYMRMRTSSSVRIKMEPLYLEKPLMNLPDYMNILRIKSLPAVFYGLSYKIVQFD